MLFLSSEVNALKQRPQKTLVKIVAASEMGLATSNPAALQAVEVPSFADHPLVKGSTYRDIPLAVVSTGLDTKACGVMGKQLGPIGAVIFCNHRKLLFEMEN